MGMKLSPVSRGAAEKKAGVYSIMSRIFYHLIGKALHTDMTRASDFRLLDRKAIDALLDVREQNIFFRAMSSWIGFKRTEIEFDVRDRVADSSKWSKMALVR